MDRVGDSTALDISLGLHGGLLYCGLLYSGSARGPGLHGGLLYSGSAQDPCQLMESAVDHFGSARGLIEVTFYKVWHHHHKDACSE